MGMMILENPKGNEFLTVAQIATRLNVTTRSVARWISVGLLKGAFKIDPSIKNSPFIVPQSSVEEFEAQRGKTSNK